MAKSDKIRIRLYQHYFGSLDPDLHLGKKNWIRICKEANADPQRCNF
jgi:predicted DNA-binding protein (MmcQ/YjbR family)